MRWWCSFTKAVKSTRMCFPYSWHSLLWCGKAKVVAAAVWVQVMNQSPTDRTVLDLWGVGHCFTWQVTSPFWGLYQIQFAYFSKLKLVYTHSTVWQDCHSLFQIPSLPLWYSWALEYNYTYWYNLLVSGPLLHMEGSFKIINNMQFHVH